jgi:hypothetical protein
VNGECGACTSVMPAKAGIHEGKKTTLFQMPAMGSGLRGNGGPQLGTARRTGNCLDFPPPSYAVPPAFLIAARPGFKGFNAFASH